MKVSDLGMGIKCLLLSCIGCVVTFAQQAPLKGIRVDKKPGAETGDAVITLDTKVKRIQSQAYQAWPIEKGKNALVLFEMGSGQECGPHIQYVEGETRKHRDLGAVPFSSAVLKETVAGVPAFVLSGVAAGKPYIAVADSEHIHGRIEGSFVRIQGTDLTYRRRDTGAEAVVPVGDLLAINLTGIYSLPPESASHARFIQFLDDGTAALLAISGEAKSGRWSTDGQIMSIRLDGTVLDVPRSELSPVNGVPAGMRLELRLIKALESNHLKAGDQVDALLISPAVVDGKLYLPQGSVFKGTVTEAHGVGWGVKHETAALTIEFKEAKLPDGESVLLHTRLQSVENAQEKVNEHGKIQGIRSTGTLGQTAESKIGSVASLDPVAYVFSNFAATAALGFAEPEILYPAGTEILVQLTAPLIRDKTFSAIIPPVANSAGEQQNLVDFTRQLSFRTMTSNSKKPSDLTNLMFIGPEAGLRRAFQAAGWKPADELTANATFQTVKSLAGTQNYQEAPMSLLLLDERPPIFTLSKTTNTFNSRHHLRVFDPHVRYENLPVYTSSSTQDIGIGFSRKHKTFIHIIDQYIDNERTKVINDLQFTGCVEEAQLIPRPWVPRDAFNSTGDELRTDGAIAVLRISDCKNPRGITVHNAVPPQRFERITRDTALSVRNYLYRSNLVYQGVSGGIQLRQYLVHRNDLKPNSGAWRQADLSGTEFKGLASVPPERQPSARAMPSNAEPSPAADPEMRSHRWDPPRYEIALSGGYLRLPQVRADFLGVLLTPEPGHETLPFGATLLADDVSGGWSVGLTLTLNTWKWVSNEFSYTYMRGKYEYASLTFSEDPSDGIESDGSGLATRQFAYNVLVHARPPKSRWRPYVEAGPVLQLLSLTDTALKKPGGVYRLGLQNIGIFKSAFDFGSTPPLEGGGIFQFGLQYGGGIKVRVLPRFTIRADFRETWTPNPRFLRDSYTTDYFDTENYKVEFIREPPDAKFRQQVISLGFAFTF